MEITIDLHIHSCLSPCADSMMTPCNIVGMAALNGMGAIAITDHNAVENVETALAVGEAYGVTVIPGMELETIEEIHVVCLFENIDSLKSFCEEVRKTYEPPKNNICIFGNQSIVDCDDQIVSEYGPMLLAPTGVSIDEVFCLADSFGGFAYPAHIDRDSYSALTTLGVMPDKYEYKLAEISYSADIDKLLDEHEELKSFFLMRASDSHYIDRLPEKGFSIVCAENSPKGIIETLKTLHG